MQKTKTVGGQRMPEPRMTMEMKRKLLDALLQESDYFDSFFITEDLLNFGVQLGIDDSNRQAVFLAMKDRVPHIFLNIEKQEVEVFVSWEEVPARVRVVANDKDILDIDYASFFEFLGQVDAVFTPVYPLGTIIALSAQEIPEVFKSLLMDGYLTVIITGRRIPMDDLDGVAGHFTIDYVARPWPMGEMPDTQPMVISNQMIDHVVQTGFSNEFEKLFVTDYIDTNQFSSGRISFSFMTAEQFLNATSDVEKEGGVSDGN